MKHLIGTIALGVSAVVLAAGFAVAVESAERDYWQGVEDAQTEDFGDTPRCTDAIADAGGICHGEPLPPCGTEDSNDCYWDAATMGNGIGRSFIVEHDVVTYTD